MHIERSCFTRVWQAGGLLIQIQTKIEAFFKWIDCHYTFPVTPSSCDLLIPQYTCWSHWIGRRVYSSNILITSVHFDYVGPNQSLILITGETGSIYMVPTVRTSIVLSQQIWISSISPRPRFFPSNLHISSHYTSIPSIWPDFTSLFALPIFFLRPQIVSSIFHALTSLILTRFNLIYNLKQILAYLNT